MWVLFDRLPQPGDVCVERPRITQIIGLPHLSEDLLTSDGLSLMLCQQLEQSVDHRRQAHANTINDHLALGRD